MSISFDKRGSKEVDSEVFEGDVHPDNQRGDTVNGARSSTQEDARSLLSHASVDSDAPTDLHIDFDSSSLKAALPNDLPATEQQEQLKRMEWPKATYGETNRLYKKAEELWADGKGDPEPMKIFLEVLKTKRAQLEQFAQSGWKPSIDFACTWSPIDECRDALMELNKNASVLYEALVRTSKEGQPVVWKPDLKQPPSSGRYRAPRKTTLELQQEKWSQEADQFAQAEVASLKADWEKQGWGKLRLFKNPYTLMTYGGLKSPLSLKFDEKQAFEDARNKRYAALVEEEKQRVRETVAANAAAQVVKNGALRTQLQYGAAQEAYTQELGWREGTKAEGTGFGGFADGVWKGIKSWATGKSIWRGLNTQFDTGKAFENALVWRVTEEAQRQRQQRERMWSGSDKTMAV